MQPLGATDEETVEMSALHGDGVRHHKSWLLHSESEEEADSSDAEEGRAGPPKRQLSRTDHVIRCYYCRRLFFCCSRSTCKMVILSHILVFSFLAFALAYRANSCWTARDELIMLTQFEQDSASVKDGPWPLRNAHSHNDYQQTIPLKEAMLAGFCSVEGDVFLLNGVLYLGHAVAVTDTTLEDIYVKPMIKLAKDNGGTIYKRALRLGTCQQVTLLIDIKSVETRIQTWEALEAMLHRLDSKLSDGRPIFETFDERGNVVYPEDVSLPSPIRVVVTGLSGIVGDIANRMLAKPLRKTSIDLNSPTEDEQPRKVASWISQKWEFPWPDDASPVAFETTKKAVAERVRYARRNNLSVRFWGTKEDPKIWQFLLNMGVDLINTDTLFSLHSFLVGKTSGPHEGSR